MSGNAFNTFIQIEVPKRPYLETDVDQETLIIRRGNGPRQLQALKLAEGQTVLFKDGQLRAVKAGGLANGMDVRSITQKAASDHWVLAHNMNCLNVMVQVIGSDNKVFNPSDIEYIDANTVHVTLPQAVAGTALLVGFAPVA